MRPRPTEILVCTLLAVLGCGSGEARLSTGLDLLCEQEFAPLRGLAVGVVTNQTGANREGEHVVDLLYRAPDVRLHAIFAPEHGLRSLAERGESVADGRDEKTGCPVYSLYGSTRRPTPQMLRGVDVLLFDIQDVGARCYTYLSTLTLVLQAAAENGIPLYLLDRPNPISGALIEGPMLQPAWKSFVGFVPVPLRHGMTFGELASMICGEGWIEGAECAELKVFPVRSWNRNDFYPTAERNWLPTSPNIRSLQAALLYPGLVLLEASNVSEGRGTGRPFELFGAPWISGRDLKSKLETMGFSALKIDTVSFIPRSIPGAALNPKHLGVLCRGCRLEVTDPARFHSVAFGIHLLRALKQLYPEHLTLNASGLNRLSGDERLYNGLEKNTPVDDIIAQWSKAIGDFERQRRPYLLYP